jgi:hypothetical protein
MANKALILTVYGQNHLRPDWQIDLSGSVFTRFCQEMAADLTAYGIVLSVARNEGIRIDVNSYADLLNAVRISSPADGFVNKCVGHVIGKSPNLNLLEDIRRAITRVAFAPETIPPDDHNRKLCHNCGCGC